MQRRSSADQTTASSLLVKRCRLGRGVFAARDWTAGQLITEVTGAIVQGDETGEDHFEIDHELVLVPHAPCRYLNHSCAPNAELYRSQSRRRTRLWLYAARRIRPGDEITIDYGCAADDPMPCQCGMRRCRGWIVAAEELPRLLEAR
jgi:SET domain-containing protein